MAALRFKTSAERLEETLAQLNALDGYPRIKIHPDPSDLSAEAMEAPLPPLRYQPGHILDIADRHVQPQVINGPFEEEYKDEQKKEQKDEKHTPLRKKYLVSFTASQIEEFLKKHAALGVKTAADLENLLTDHQTLYGITLVSFVIGILLNLGYIAFVATTGASGIQTIVQIVSPDTKVPDDVARGIGIPIGVFDIALFMLAFSANREAVTSVLELLEWRLKSLGQRMREGLSYAYHAPHKALGHLLFDAMLLTYNSASMMTVLLGFMGDLSLSEKIGLSLFVLFFGNIYMMTYSNTEARMGLAQNVGYLSHMLEELRRGNIALPLQTAIQALSTITLSAYPVYYYIGLSIAKAYNVPLKTAELLGYIVAGLTFARGSLVMFPLPYHHYMDPTRQLRTLMMQLREQQLGNHAAPARAPQISVDDSIHRIENEVKREKGCLRLSLEYKPGFVKDTLLAGVTLTLGVLTAVDPSPTGLLILAACLFFTLVSARANLNRTTQLNACEKGRLLLPPEGKKPTPAILPNTCRGNLLKATAGFLALDGAVTDFITVMGSLLTDNDALKLFFVIIAFYRLLIEYDFYNDKTKAGLAGLMISPTEPPARVTQTSSNFFTRPHLQLENRTPPDVKEVSLNINSDSKAPSHAQTDPRFHLPATPTLTETLRPAF